jgi:ATP-dependent exoDNAse (exonuclease V) beta subunit
MCIRDREWPVVIPVGLWRGIGKASDKGIRLLRDAQEGPQVFFDGASVPQETKDARERERWRELVRLLYVTLTRPRRALVLPWADGWGGKQREEPTFAGLWGDWTGAAPEIDDTWRELAPAPRKGSGVETVERIGGGAGSEPDEARATPKRPAPALPTRLLPHQLAHAPDLARTARHESAVDEPVPVRAGSEEAIDYGLWWHETLEFFPWGAEPDVLETYAVRRLSAAEGLGLGERALAEWSAWLASDTRAELETARWVRQAELAVFAPLRANEWMDGVMDLVLHDAAANEAWVVDWKTNRRRAGEADAALLERLRAEYAPQLEAYAVSLRDAFPGARIRGWVYSTAAALRVEIVSANT